MNAVEYKKAVNSGKMKAPKVDPYANHKARWATVLGHNTPAAYKAYMNGGEK